MQHRFRKGAVDQRHWPSLFFKNLVLANAFILNDIFKVLGIFLLLKSLQFISNKTWHVSEIHIISYLATAVPRIKCFRAASFLILCLPLACLKNTWCYLCSYNLKSRFYFKIRYSTKTWNDEMKSIVFRLQIPYLYDLTHQCVKQEKIHQRELSRERKPLLTQNQMGYKQCNMFHVNVLPMQIFSSG